MQGANTVHMQLYTPSGVRLNFVIGIQDGKLTETLPALADIETMIAASGYLETMPGVEPGEGLETITHVIRRTQHNKKDGTQTPCIGMYFENKSLVYGKKAYLNTQEDIATFERLSGLKVSAMPNFPSDIPLRDNPDAATFIIPVKTPFQIRMVDGTYTDKETGEVKPCKDFAGFYDIGKPQTATTGNGQAGSTIAIVDKPPVTSGNAETDDAWLPKVFSLTEFLYDGIKQHQENSINKLIRERSISSDMKPIVAAAVVFAHKAYEKFRLNQDDITDQLGKSLGDYLRSGKTLKNAWDDIQPQADTLPPTGTDDIPF